MLDLKKMSGLEKDQLLDIEKRQLLLSKFFDFLS